MKRDWLRIAAWGACSLILVVYLSEFLVGESRWLAYLTMSLPPQVWLLPGIVVFAASLVVKRLKLAVLTLVAALLGLVVLGGFSVGHASPTSPSIEMMTFNVEKLTDHTPTEVAEVIRRENPDVVCLQEAAKLPPPWHPPTELAKALPDYRLIADGEVAILTRLDVVGTQSVPLGAGPASRPALVARLKAHGREISVVCVHLQFFPWDDLSIGNIEQVARDREIQKATLERIVASEPGPLAICGDFNSPPIAPIPRALSRTLIDAYATTTFGFGWTIPSGLPNRRLDYIFAGHGLAPAASRVVAVEASDHRPLIATLGFR